MKFSENQDWPYLEWREDIWKDRFVWIFTLPNKSNAVDGDGRIGLSFLVHCETSDLYMEIPALLGGQCL